MAKISREFDVDKVDDWANGIWHALMDLLCVMADTHPEVLVQLEDKWRECSDNYLAAKTKNYVTQDARMLEARKMLYQMLQSFGKFDKARKNIDLKESSR